MKNINFKSVEEILEFAIEQEQKTASLYLEMATEAKTNDLKELWHKLAQDEEAHKEFMASMLDKLKNGESTCCCEKPILQNYEPLAIPYKDFTEKEKIKMTALKHDLEMIDVYIHLAGKVSDVKCSNMLLHIANQEMAHKKMLVRDLNMLNFY